MKNKKIFFIISTAVFVAVEILLGYLLQIHSDIENTVFSFSSVVLACLFCIIFIERSWDYALTQLALICTVCADWFLVCSDPQIKLPAMFFFSTAQLAYFTRIYINDENKKRRIWHLSVRIALSAIIIIITLAVLGTGADALALVSMFYYANLFLNLVFAFIEFKKHYLLAFGLLFFILCDTAVGLSLLNGYIMIPEDSVIYDIIYPGFDLIWAFYVPSQTLIATSLLQKKLKKLK